jgi:hypothetical protein
MRKTELEKTSRYLRRVDGIQKNLGKVAAVMLDGRSYAPSAIAAIYSDWLAKAQAVQSAKNAWLVAVGKRDKAEKALLPLDAAFKRFLLSYYGLASATLVDYGVDAPRVGKKSAMVKRLAAEKARATRAARGTMGKRQKKAVKAPAA